MALIWGLRIKKKKKKKKKYSTTDKKREIPYSNFTPHVYHLFVIPEITLLLETYLREAQAIDI